MVKHLNTIFDLLLFSFIFLQRKKVLFSLLFLTGTTLFSSNTPVISISPAFFDINESSGMVTVNLDVIISEDPNASDINITWKTIDGSATAAAGNYVSDTNKIIFAKGTSTASKRSPITVTVDSNISITNTVFFTVELSQIDVHLQTYTALTTVSTITIVNNDPPTANDKTYQVAVNRILIGNIITDAPADSDPEGDLISLNAHNSTLFPIGPDGNFTYSPTSSLCGYSFDYNITDGAEVSETATIVIDAINTPIAFDDYFAVEANVPLNENVLRNDGRSTYNVSFSQPFNGTVTNNGNGNFTYLPNTNFTGSDTFDYNITDGSCSTIASAEVYITVAHMCEGTEYILCSSPSLKKEIKNNDPKVYWFYLKDEAVVDIDLSNLGPQELQYDFKSAKCKNLWTSGTTSYLSQKAGNIHIKQRYPRGLYFFGFNSKERSNIELSICSDANLSGGQSSRSFFSNIGINDAGNSYGSLPEIRTKLVSKNFGLRASFLDETGRTAVHDGGTDKAPIAVSLSLVNNGGDIVAPSIIYLEIADNKSFVEMRKDRIANYLDGDGGISGNIPSKPNVVDYAAKIRKYKIASMNYGTISRVYSGLNCQWNSISSSMCGLPVCFNYEDTIKEVFPPAFFPHVLTCLYGDGGGSSPCDPNAYNGNCAGNKQTISPERYNNYMGCFQCLHDASGPPIYSDDFAIRPNEFNVSITGGEIFIAGENTNITFKALGGRQETISTLPLPPALSSSDYNETENTSFRVDVNISDPTKVCQHMDINMTPNVTFSHGIAPGTIYPENFVFHNIGNVTITVQEINGSEFAIVDVDDTNDSQRLIPKFISETFSIIPAHFEINTTLSNHNTDNNFTYISADLNMSSTLKINITAQNDLNKTTFNYTHGCYANPIDLNLSFDYSSDPMTPNILDHLLYLLSEENNAYTKEGNSSNIKNIDITDPADLPTAVFPAGDHNGTAILTLKLNFDRKYNEVVNPFEMNVTEIHIQDNTYRPKDVNGTGTPDNNATYYYARIKPSKFFYDDITENSVATPISIVIYGDPVTSLFILDTDIFIPTNEYDWYLSTKHTPDDGNVTLVSRDTSRGNVAPIDPMMTDSISPNVKITAVNTRRRPLIVDINLTGTDPWLIYNPNAHEIPNPFYRVRFIGTSDWAGHGDTGNVVDKDSSTKKNRRLGW